MQRKTPQDKVAPTGTDTNKKTILAQSWNGPLPPPAALEEFNRIIPNGAERIMAMVEKEQQHRIEYDNKALNASISDARLGKIIGFVLVVIAIAAAVFASYLGAPPIVSCAIVGVPVMALIKSIFDRNK